MAASPFRPASELLVQYARYHRDKRNIVSHFIGIPLIVLGLGVLLARLQLGPLNAAWLVWAVTALWYLSRGLPALGLATVALNALLMALAQPLATGSMAAWLGWGLGLFALGWLIQFVGHYWEGRKPAFVDDLVGLLVGPMFIVAEWMMAAGWARELAAEIERRAGPTRARDAALPAAR